MAIAMEPYSQPLATDAGDTTDILPATVVVGQGAQSVQAAVHQVRSNATDVAEVAKS